MFVQWTVESGRKMEAKEGRMERDGSRRNMPGLCDIDTWILINTQCGGLGNVDPKDHMELGNYENRQRENHTRSKTKTEGEETGSLVPSGREVISSYIIQRSKIP